MDAAKTVDMICWISGPLLSSTLASAKGLIFMTLHLKDHMMPHVIINRYFQKYLLHYTIASESVSTSIFHIMRSQTPFISVTSSTAPQFHSSHKRNNTCGSWGSTRRNELHDDLNLLFPRLHGKRTYVLAQILVRPGNTGRTPVRQNLIRPYSSQHVKTVKWNMSCKRCKGVVSCIHGAFVSFLPVKCEHLVICSIICYGF